MSSPRRQKAQRPIAMLPGARPAPFPPSLSPMLAETAPAPFVNRDWLFEPKLDGIRAIALIRPGEVRLLSRRGLEMGRQFPALLEELSRLEGRSLALDGEIVAPDERGVPSFQRLQRRLNLEREADLRRMESQVPVIYYVFDLLYLDGYDLRSVPLAERKAALAQALPPSQQVRLLEYFQEDGEAAFQAALEHGLEGVIAKERSSLYEEGRRSRWWLKVKALLSDEFVIGGYTRGMGSRADTFGALLLGRFDENGRLTYVGHVGTGFDDQSLAELRARLEALQTPRCPFAQSPPQNAPATWVRPELVAEVKFAQWTRDGHLRAPVFLRLREDKPAAEVRAPAGPRTTPPSSENILGLLTPRAKRLDLQVQGHTIVLTNLDKELWPPFGSQPAITKGDLIAYLVRVSPYLLPHLRNRPITLVRCPNGIGGQRFFQRHWPAALPSFVETAANAAEEGWILCNNLPTLLWLGQAASLELHAWLSRTDPLPGEEDDPLGRPDFIAFDLDPRPAAADNPTSIDPEAYQRAVEVALVLREVLEDLSLQGFVKTSGHSGLHVYVPIRRTLPFEAARTACETIARFLARRHPRAVTLDRSPTQREGRVLVDYSQNARQKSLVAPYSPRAVPQATISTPLRWEELEHVRPDELTIATVPERLAQSGDPWLGILAAPADLAAEGQSPAGMPL